MKNTPFLRGVFEVSATDVCALVGNVRGGLPLKAIS